MGMRAATGAIAGASVRDGFVEFQVLGGGAARGICGSGLVDVVAAGLELGRIAATGRFAGGEKAWPLIDSVVLLQRDVRELQLAKGAVAAGIRLLLGQLGAAAEALDRVHLAGAFGNYVDHRSARRIGLLDFPPEKVSPAGNTALLGAKVALLSRRPEERDFAALRRLVRHVPLADDPAFEETYVGAMPFPEAA